MKTKLKEEAVRLRKKGLTYSEILQRLPVAKSTIDDKTFHPLVKKYIKNY
jgi:orotate phosphoribosyltransferase-like protein